VDVLTDYINELKLDAVINELNIKEKSLVLPGLKAKWVSRLINHKNTLNNLERSKKKLIKNLIPQVKENMPVRLSDNVIKESAESTVEVQKINNEIDREKMLVDFLEKAEKTVSSYSFDISNIIKIMQLETL
jgi:hypothetical protein